MVTGGRRSGAMSGSRGSPQDGAQAPAGLEFAAALLPLWGFPPGTGITAAGEQGTNNRTFLVGQGQQRYVLRVSGFLYPSPRSAPSTGSCSGCGRAAFPSRCPSRWPRPTGGR